MPAPCVGNAPTMGAYILVFAASWLLWMLLAGSLHPQELLAGGVVAAIVTILSGQRLMAYSGLKFTPMAPVHLIRYLLHFAGALLVANLDMARRVLSPSLPIRPAVVEVETGLKSPLAQLLLANSITLTPGTLSVDVEEGIMIVHWIDCPPDTDLAEATRVIAAGFESRIAGFLS